jgi:hypothetical protein
VNRRESIEAGSVAPAARRLWARILPVLLGLTLLAILVPLRATPALADGPTYLYAQVPCTPVYTAASKQSPMITQLMGGTDVTLLDATKTWAHVRIWSGVEGYIPATTLGGQPPASARQGVCNFPGLPDAEQTQFIVITHNQVTMTHADTIYGVEMGGESFSRVVSLRLSEVASVR